MAIVAFLSYLLGSLPFGLFAGWLAGKDIRKEGSGNIGATNVVRVCGWRWGLPVFALDALKGFAPVFWLAPSLLGAERAALLQNQALTLVLAALAAILGHNFPIWLRFKGGKGVATSAGALLALLPLPLAAAAGAFGLVLAATRYVSLGSMIAGAVLVAAHLGFSWQAGQDPFARTQLPRTVAAILMCLLVLLRHRANIQRLIAGTESKIGAKKEAVPAGGALQ